MDDILDLSDDSPAVRRSMLYFNLMLERVRADQPARQPGDRELLDRLTGERVTGARFDVVCSA